jgi:hypothetical protein
MWQIRQVRPGLLDEVLPYEHPQALLDRKLETQEQSAQCVQFG